MLDISLKLSKLRSLSCYKFTQSNYYANFTKTQAVFLTILFKTFCYVRDDPRLTITMKKRSKPLSKHWIGKTVKKYVGENAIANFYLSFLY